MNKKFRLAAERYLKLIKNRRNWRKVVRAMACVVVFCTTYAMILPAITMEDNKCGLPEHTHSESCYEKVLSESVAVLACDYESLAVHEHESDCRDAEGNLICGEADYLVHTHSGECLDANGVLVCRLPEVEEHEHTEECYGVAETEPAETEAVATEPADPAEAESEPTEPESEPAEVLELICGKEEIRLHSHDEEDCYETYLDEEGNEQKRLICTRVVVLEHIHAETCYVTEEVPVADADVLACTLAEGHVHGEGCYDETGTLICEEVENHTHGDMCYGTWKLICGLAEHTHNEGCRTAEKINKTLTQIGTEPAASEPGISTMALPRDPKVEATEIGNTGITWELSTNAKGEAFLRFDTKEGVTNAAIPDYTDEDNRPWREAISLHCPGLRIHVEFAGNVKTVGTRALTWVPIASIDWGNITEIRPHAFTYSSGPENLEIPGQITKVGEYAFAWREDIQSIKLNEGIEYLGSWSLYAGNYTGTLCIPASVKYIAGPPLAKVNAYEVAEGNINYRAIDGVLFTTENPVNEDGSDIIKGNCLVDYPKGRKTDEYYIPEGTKIVGPQAFAYAENIERLEIPATVNTLMGQCFFGAQIGEIVIQDRSEENPLEAAGEQLKAATGITNVQYPGDSKIVLYNLFHSETVYDRYNHFTIPKKVTEIGDIYGHFPNLKTVTYNAAKANIEAEKIFDSSGKFDLIIGKDVDTVQEDLSLLARNAGGIYFQRNPEGGFYENSFSCVIGKPFGGAGKPLETISGNCSLHVDSNGVLYSIQPMSGTARVVYVSIDCPEEITIPKTIRASVWSGAPENFTVNGVEQDAFCWAENLQCLKFEDVSQITYLGKYAMANCPTLARVVDLASGTEALTVEEAEALFTEASTAGKDLFYNTGLDRYPGDQNDDGILDGTGQKSLTVKDDTGHRTEIISLAADSPATWIGSENSPGRYEVLTGNTVVFTISADNTSGNEDYVYRAFFRTTGDPGEGGGLDIYPGKVLNYKDEDGNEIQIVCKGLDGHPGVVYLEFVLRDDATIGFPIQAAYRSPESAGGGVEACAMIQPIGEAIREEDLFDPDATIQVQFVTERIEYTLKKEGGQPVNIVSDGNTGSNGEYGSNGKPDGNLIWNITMKAEKQQTSNNGRDDARSVEFVDIIELPAGFDWNDKIVAVLEKGPVQFNKVQHSSAEPFSEELFIGGLHVATIIRPRSSADMTYLEAYWHETGTLAIRWECVSSNTGKIDNDLIFSLYPDAISIKMQEISTGEGYRIWNRVNAVVHYSYSEPAPLGEAAAYNEISGGDANVMLKKTGTNPRYFGEDIQYTVELYNSGAKPYENEDGYQHKIEDTLSVNSYIKPENMQKLFGTYGSDLTITITRPILAQWVPVQAAEGNAGEMTWKNSGNSDMGPDPQTVTQADMLSITFDQEKQIYRVEIVSTGVYAGLPTKIYESDDLSEALKNAGYAVTGYDTYKVVWTLNQPGTKFMLGGGEKKTLEICATQKTNFHIAGQDWPISFPYDQSVLVENRAAVYYYTSDNGRGVLPNTAASVQNSMYREVYLYKTGYKDGMILDGEVAVTDGSVLDYLVDIRHHGSGSYENLPVVDDLYGDQYLLVPDVAANKHLKERYGLEPKVIDEISYYVLTEGTYENVTVGEYYEYAIGGEPQKQSVTAAVITVGPPPEEPQVSLGGNLVYYTGVHTKIKWYFANIPGGDYSRRIEYKAVVRTKEDDNTYEIGSGSWLNDRKTTRLYDFVGKKGTIIDFEKKIVMPDGLVRRSAISEGETVTYRLTLRNTADHRFELCGANLADGLPISFENFRWSKDGNVVLDKIETVGSGIQYNEELLYDWRIEDSYAGEKATGRQYIVWPEDLKIEFTEQSAMHLYFKLTFPEGELWKQYVDATRESSIINTLYVQGFTFDVTHDLVETNEVLLQKGVSGMYHYGAYREYDPTVDTTYYPAGRSRREYNNRDMKNRAVHYYVTLYNGGDKRLYLDTLYDMLPEGFTFIEMMNDPASNHRNSGVDMGTVDTQGKNNLVKIDANGETVVYVSALVKPEMENGILTFRIEPGNGTNKLRKDEENGKYYLNRGEAIVFGYLCDIPEEQYTKDIAINTIAMPYLDYLGDGVNLSDTKVSAVDYGTFKGQPKNDGAKNRMSDWYVTDTYKGFPSAGNRDQEWLLSDVAVVRGYIKPGVSKIIERYVAQGNEKEYTHSVAPSDILIWKVTLKNDGTQTMVDYVFTDVMPAPYLFQGKITYRFYDVNGEEVRSSREICTIPARSPLQFDANGKPIVQTLQLTSPYGNQTVKTDGQWREVSGPWVLMSIGYDEDNNEVLRIRCTPASVGIPEGGRIEVELSSAMPSNDYVNTVYTNVAMLHPWTQDFAYEEDDPSIVMDKETGKPGVKNSDDVTVSLSHSTSAEKRVTERDNPDNTAASRGTQGNTILLGSTDSIFTYRLTVKNETDQPMTKLVFIDNLPEPGDHSPFNKDSLRHSAFTVNFAESLNFAVRIIPEEGEPVLLNSGDYTLEFTEDTYFGPPNSSDWNLKDTQYHADWIRIPWSENSAEWLEYREKVRAFRLSIQDADATLIPPKSTIEISFDARAGADVKPETIAWNSFGYHYGLKGEDYELEAMPRAVGVVTPRVPYLQKRLVDMYNNEVEAEEETVFRFLVYEGEALGKTYASADELRTALDAAGRQNDKIEEFSVRVDAGQRESGKEQLYAEDLVWKQGSKYTVVEIDSSEKYNFCEFENAQGFQYTFTYNGELDQTIVCVNVLDEWTVQLEKTDPNGNALSGAVFALYSSSEQGKVSQDVADQWGAEINLGVVEEMDDWHLIAVAESDEEGMLSFTNLVEDTYYLLEIKAPDGYNLPAAGMFVEKKDCDSKNNILGETVENEPGYEIPGTGGMGTNLFYVFGSTMMLAAVVLPVIRRRRIFGE